MFTWKEARLKTDKWANENKVVAGGGKIAKESYSNKTFPSL